MAAEISPPVEDSATAMVCFRAISCAAIFSAMVTSSFMSTPAENTLQQRLLLDLRLVGERVPDHANEIPGRKLGRRPFGIEVGERLCRHRVVLALAVLDQFFHAVARGDQHGAVFD